MKRLATKINSNVHPWMLHVTKDKQQYSAAVHYYSTLYKPLKEGGGFLKYEKIPIVGLDFIKNFSIESVKNTGMNVILKIQVQDLSASNAKIEWVEGDNENELSPIKLDGNKIQTEARVVIASFREDTRYKPGVSNVKKIKSAYVLQFVTTNLILANMVFDGVPVIYPVPISGFQRKDA